MSNEITKTSGNTKIGFTSYITSTGITQKINNIIGDEKKGARFISSIVSAVNNNPVLKECDNQSIISGACSFIFRSSAMVSVYLQEYLSTF